MDERPPTPTEEFLKGLELFSGLEEEELEALAEIAAEYRVPAGAVVAYQRDVADCLYVVVGGRLYAAQVDEQGITRDARAYAEGDYFNDVWLFTPGTHQTTVKASQDSRLLIIEQGPFLAFLDAYPGALDALQLTPSAAEAAGGSSLARPARPIRTLSLLPEETVLYHSRRSRWLLAIKVAGPLLGALFAIVAVGLLIGYQSGGALLLAGLPSLALIGLAAVQWVDWLNDYFAVTNKHVIHREYHLLRFHALVNKTPLDQIQSVEVERPNVLAMLTNTGTTRVTTASSRGVIYFDYIDEPQVVCDAINTLREEVRAMDAGRAQALMRRSLEGYFQASPPLEPVAADEELVEEAPAAAGAYRSPWAAFRRAISSRVETGPVITYRKHFFTLVQRAWLPALISLALAAGVMLVPSVQVAVALLVALFLAGGWLIWRFEDWRNDTFQVTDRYVIDIDRRPFGFGESRKQADLGNVQNVNANKPGLLASVFNFGNVVIETAGASANITFERVVNPNLVQSDIFSRRDLFRQRQRVQEGEQRRKEYAVMLDVYHQAQEQGRIPRRTLFDETG
ncbi:MAG: cyclic nucleotide-binding domain-containing protein [Candidatus Promineifilaceae bacterium]